MGEERGGRDPPGALWRAGGGCAWRARARLLLTFHNIVRTAGRWASSPRVAACTRPSPRAGPPAAGVSLRTGLRGVAARVPARRGARAPARYWRRRSRVRPACCSCPRTPGPAVQTTAGRASRSRCRPAGRALGRLSRREGATLFMDAFGVLPAYCSRATLAAGSGRGTPVANRTRPMSGAWVCSATAALRRTSGEPTFRGWWGGCARRAWA